MYLHFQSLLIDNQFPYEIELGIYFWEHEPDWKLARVAP